MPYGDRDQIVAVSIDLADAARAAIHPWFRTPSLPIDSKDASGFDPVTEADRAAERAMREVLAERRPRDGIRGEEFGAHRGDTGLTWVLDPIDGTRAFVAGTPTWGVLIAVVGEDRPLHGIIDQPHTQERWIGGLSDPTLTTPHGTQPLGTRKGRSLAEATLLSTFPEIGTVEDRAAFERVALGAKLVRYGLDCYGYGLLAAGHVDLVIEAGLQDYDVCAPIAVIEAAGGVVTTWEGGPAHHGGRVLAAATPALHAEAMALLTAAA